MAALTFSILSGAPHVGGANAVVADSTLATFAALVDTKAGGGTTYTAPDGVRSFADHTPAWMLELEGALRSWLGSHASDVSAGFAALGTDANLPQSNVSLRPSAPYIVSVSSGRGGGTGLHPAVFARFRIATDYRSVQRTGSFSGDLAAAMAAWSYGLRCVLRDGSRPPEPGSASARCCSRAGARRFTSGLRKRCSEDSPRLVGLVDGAGGADRHVAARLEVADDAGLCHRNADVQRLVIRSRAPLNRGWGESSPTSPCRGLSRGKPRASGRQHEARRYT